MPQHDKDVIKLVEAYTSFDFWAYIKHKIHLIKYRLAIFTSVLSPSDENTSEERAQINAHAERLLNEYGNSILRLAYSYLHNMSDAEDILQDTLIQYIKKMPDFESSEHEKKWLIRVAGNLSKNKIQHNKIREADELNDQLENTETEDLAFVWDAVKKLPVKYREVIHLFYYEGYSCSQIAEILSKNEQTVRSLLSRGRAKLKTVLKEVYDFG